MGQKMLDGGMSFIDQVFKLCPFFDWWLVKNLYRTRRRRDGRVV